MGSFFKDPRVGSLAKELKLLTKARSNTDAVVRALENEKARLLARGSLTERIDRLVTNRKLPLPKRSSDHKQISDEIWEE